VITDKKQRILWMSPLHLGSEHDFCIFKQEAQHLPFENKPLHVDLGFQGIAKKLRKTNLLHIPHKKPWKKELTQKQKDENRILARFRVTVEHALARLKAFFILRIENRMHSTIKLDQCAEICAMLANFKLIYN
jgi:hypothetical protein